MSDTKTAGHLGKLWTVVGTYPSYEAAAARADNEKSNRVEVKVKHTESGFTVRTRATERSVTHKSEEVLAESPSKKSKLKAKDRRARERQGVDSDDTEE